MKRLSLWLAPLFLAGCVAATSRVHYYAGEEFEMRTPPKRIQIFESQRPEDPFIVIARIEAEQAFGGSEEVFAEMRKKASEIGADAIIDLSYGEEKHEWGGPVIEKKEETKYKPQGAVTTTRTTVQPPAVSTTMKITGVAIRFKDKK